MVAQQAAALEPAEQEVVALGVGSILINSLYWEVILFFLRHLVFFQ